MAALADEIFVAHAAPQSQTEQFCRAVLSWGKPLYTLASDANAHLITLGVQPLQPPEARGLWETLRSREGR